jgi:hypothetical protein
VAPIARRYVNCSWTGVILIRGIEVSEDGQRTFARSLGELRLGSVNKEEDEGLQKVTLDKEQNPGICPIFLREQAMAYGRDL